MQPDGTLNPSAEPVELPDPSDSDASYWLARTIWALGEGYAAFQARGPRLRAVPRADASTWPSPPSTGRCSTRYGRYLDIDGRAHAGLADRRRCRRHRRGGARAGGLRRRRRPGDGRAVLTQLSEGIAAARRRRRAAPGRSAACCPWALSRSVWHAWGSQMPACAGARRRRHWRDRRWRRVAARDSFTFDPWLLTSGGPDNGRLPPARDADPDRVRRRLPGAVSWSPPERSAPRQLAGITAAWFFGANASGAPTYDPATGITFDGVARDGTVEPQLRRRVDDPRAAHDARARRASGGSRDRQDGGRPARSGVQYVAGRGRRSSAGGATAVKPESTWTGESQYAGTGYVALRDGGTATFELASHRRRAAPAGRRPAAAAALP